MRANCDECMSLDNQLSRCYKEKYELRRALHAMVAYFNEHNQKSLDAFIKEYKDKEGPQREKISID